MLHRKWGWSECRLGSISTMNSPPRWWFHEVCMTWPWLLPKPKKKLFTQAGLAFPFNIEKEKDFDSHSLQNEVLVPRFLKTICPTHVASTICTTTSTFIAFQSVPLYNTLATKENPVTADSLSNKKKRSIVSNQKLLSPSVPRVKLDVASKRNATKSCYTATLAALLCLFNLEFKSCNVCHFRDRYSLAKLKCSLNISQANPQFTPKSLRHDCGH